MGLVERLSDPAVRKGGRRSGECPVKTILRDMPERDAAFLNDVFKKRTVSVRNIYLILLDEGFDIAQWHVKEHAAKRCNCLLGRDS